MNISRFDDKFFANITLIHEVKVFNEIQNEKKILIFDFRSRTEYDQCHVEFSINLPYDENDEEFFSTLDSKKLELIGANYCQEKETRNMMFKYKRFFIVLIMSEEKIKKKFILSEVKDNEWKSRAIKSKTIKCLLFYKALQANKVREMGIYNIGFQRFYEHYPFLTCSLNSSPMINPICGLPSEIFDHRIYVGDQNNARSIELLTSLRITHIINVTRHVENLFEVNGIKYLTIPVEDTDDYKISPYFKDAYDFIESALIGEFPLIESAVQTNAESGSEEDVNTNASTTTEAKDSTNLIKLGISDTNTWLGVFEKAKGVFMKNKILQKMFDNVYSKFNSKSRILVHCSLGVSRSSTIVMMYMMKKFSVSLSDSIDILHYHRERVSPLLEFQTQLENFEKNGCEFDNL